MYLLSICVLFSAEMSWAVTVESGETNSQTKSWKGTAHDMLNSWWYNKGVRMADLYTMYTQNQLKTGHLVQKFTGETDN